MDIFDADDFETAVTLPNKCTLKERQRQDLSLVIMCLVVWSQLWELLFLAEYALKWKLDGHKHVKRMFKKLARNHNQVLQMLARGVQGKNTGRDTELVQAEIGLAAYCHNCQGKICDRKCGPE